MTLPLRKGAVSLCFSTLPHSISKYTVTLRRLSFLRALSPSSPVPRSHSLLSPPGRHTRSKSGTVAVGSFAHMLQARVID